MTHAHLPTRPTPKPFPTRAETGLSNLARLHDALDPLPTDQARSVASVLLGMLAGTVPADTFDRLLSEALAVGK